MRNKLFGILAVGALLTACECAPECVDAGYAPRPGTSEDFKRNIKDRVFFGFNQANISQESARTLEAQANWLKTYSCTNATVEGYTDVRGTREYNTALGAKRADAAAQELRKLGVDRARLKTVSYGKDNPIVPGETEEAHAQNRVAVTIVE